MDSNTHRHNKNNNKRTTLYYTSKQLDPSAAYHVRQKNYASIFENAEYLFLNHQLPEALAAFQKYLGIVRPGLFKNNELKLSREAIRGLATAHEGLNVLNRIAACYQNMGDTKKALSIVETIHRHAPQPFVAADRALTILYLQTKQFMQAQSVLDKLSDRDFSSLNPDVYIAICSKIINHCKKPKLSITLIKRLLTISYQYHQTFFVAQQHSEYNKERNNLLHAFVLICHIHDGYTDSNEQKLWDQRLAAVTSRLEDEYRSKQITACIKQCSERISQNLQNEVLLKESQRLLYFWNQFYQDKLKKILTNDKSLYKLLINLMTNIAYLYLNRNLNDRENIKLELQWMLFCFKYIQDKIKKGLVAEAIAQLYCDLRNHQNEKLWHTIAIKVGNIREAHYNLANMYINGEAGLNPNDHKVIFEHIQKAAKAGHSPAQIIYGNWLMDGYPKTASPTKQLVRAQDEQALSWFTRAMEQGDSNAKPNIAFYYYRKGLQGTATSTTLSCKPAENSTVNIATSIEVILEHKYSKVQRLNFAHTLQLYEECLEAGDKRVLINLGNMYLLGQGVPQDFLTAMQYFMEADDADSDLGQHNLYLTLSIILYNTKNDDDPVLRHMLKTQLKSICKHLNWDDTTLKLIKSKLKEHQNSDTADPQATQKLLQSCSSLLTPKDINELKSIKRTHSDFLIPAEQRISLLLKLLSRTHISTLQLSNACKYLGRLIHQNGYPPFYLTKLSSIISTLNKHFSTFNQTIKYQLEHEDNYTNVWSYVDWLMGLVRLQLNAQHDVVSS